MGFHKPRQHMDLVKEKIHRFPPPGFFFVKRRYNTTSDLWTEAREETGKKTSIVYNEKMLELSRNGNTRKKNWRHASRRKMQKKILFELEFILVRDLGNTRKHALK